MPTPDNERSRRGAADEQFGQPQDIVLNPANDYVADFVAHMNPLNVLRAAEVMKPRDGGPPDNDAIRIGQAPLMSARQAIAQPETPLKALLEARLATGRPILVEDEGRIVGRSARSSFTRRCWGGRVRAVGRPVVPGRAA